MTYSNDTTGNPAHTPLTLGEWLPQWLERYKIRLSQTTADNYKVIIRRHIIPVLGDYELTAITGEILDMVYAQKLKANHARTVGYAHAILSAALNCAVRQEWGRLIPFNPALNIVTSFHRLIKRQRSVNKGLPYSVRDPWTVSDIACALKAIRDPKWRLLILLTAFYGLRRNEAMGLCLNDINRVKGELRVWRQLNDAERFSDSFWKPLKTEDSSRILPMVSDTWRYFLDVVEAADSPHGLLFCRDDGEPYTPHHATSKHGQLLKHHALPYVRLHDQRHAAATNVYELTGDVSLVAQLLGHSSYERNVTLCYIQFRQKRLRNAMEQYWAAILEELQ